MKKIIYGFLVVAILVGIGQGAMAETNSASTQIQNLLAQIKLLQAQLETLKEAQAKVAETAQDVKDTIKLVKSLKQGMSGDEVKALQAVLASDPSIYPEGAITGFYGSLTAKAVKAFQKKNGLSQNGSVDTQTLQKVNVALEKNPILFETSASTTGQKGDVKKAPCAVIPPGHLVAPGWLKKNGGVKPIVPECQTLPPGIAVKLGLPVKISTTTATSTPPVVDVTPPNIFNVAATSITSSGAAIMWSTGENSSGKVWYSAANPVPVATTTPVISNSSLVVAHNIAIANLASSTTYYYFVVSSDAAGNTATSSQNSFTTLVQ